MFFRTADLIIKEAISSSTEEGRKAIASILDKVQSDKQVDGEKKVLADIKPGYVWVVTSGLHSGEPNFNGDYFREDELLKKKVNGKYEGKYVFQTWIGKPVLCNHDSKLVVGEILDTWPIKKEKSIDMLLKIDEKKNPNMVSGIRNGSIKGTSMGVMVGHSYCSVCANLAYNEDEWCLIAGTDILLPDFTSKPIEEIKIGDEVVTHTGKVQKVTKLFERDVDEDLCSFRLSGEYRPLIITKNHPVLTIKSEDIHCVRDSKQSVCSAGSFYVCNSGGYECKHKLSDEIKTKEFDFTPAGDIKKEDWLLTPVIVDGVDFSNGNLDLLKLLGWYLAEGSIEHKSQGEGSYSVSFAINSNEDLLSKDIMDACKNYCDRNACTYDRGNSRCIKITNKGELAKLCIKHCGEYAQHKKLSKDILNLPNDLLEIFLKAYIEGDGYDSLVYGKTKGIAVETASKDLADQLMYICDKLELHANLIKLENEPTKLVPKEGLVIYRISMGKKSVEKLYNEELTNKNWMAGRYITYNSKLYRLRKILDLDYIKYKGKVYNFEVEGDNSYIANNMAVHNCEHLHPNKLNIKGRIYTGQDGNKYPDKIGQMVYEDNRDLEGVEDSIITLGEPADSKALLKQVLASKEDNNMPVGGTNLRSAEIRAGLSNGIVNYEGRGAVNDGSDGRAPFSLGPSTAIPKNMGVDIKALYAKRGYGSKNIIEQAADYKSPLDVVNAIASNKLKKSDAIEYVGKFRLVDAAELDEITPSMAVEILNTAIAGEDLHRKLEAEMSGEKQEHGDQALSLNEVKPEEKGPNPDGSVNPHGQMPTGNEHGDQASETNKLKPEDGQPSPDGNANPHKQTPSGKDHGTQNKEVNRSKPEGGAPTPKTAQEHGKQNKEVNKSKPEDAPKPEGASNDDSIHGDQALSEGDVKHEDPPKPDKVANLPVESDHITPEEVKQMTPVERLEEAIDMVADVKMLIDGLPDRLDGKEKKPKVPKLPGMPGEDKKPDEKSEKPEGPKLPGEEKEEKEDKEMPKMDKPEGAPPVPPILKDVMGSYAAEFVEDKVCNADSYYVVSLNKAPILQITARHAYGSDVAKYVDEFKSEDYKKELVATLNSNGAKNVFENIYGKVGIVLAQAETLPEDKFNEPAPPMQASPDALQDAANDDVQKVNYDSILQSAFATALRANPSGSVEDVKTYLQRLGTDESALSEFAGRLAQEVEHSKAEDLAGDKIPADNSTPPPAPASPETMSPDQIRASYMNLKKKSEKINQSVKELVPVLKKALNENKELKARLDAIDNQNALKARAAKMLQFASQKAEVGLIEESEVRAEALRLAQLSDAELSQEIKVVENSVKIASKISKKPDYSEVEGKDNASLGKITASVPSQFDTKVESSPTIRWSIGIPGRTKEE